jgi:DNA-binding MarR family transcriptional regulator
MLPSSIARRMLVTRPTMTGIVASLARRGLVRVVPHPTDGRMSLVEITRKGHALVHRMRPELHAAEKRWMACLDAGERRALAGLLGKLQAHAPTIR